MNLLGRNLLVRHQLLLGLMAVVIFFTNLGGYALFDEDEPKNAVCGREMFERNDWLVPTFNGGLRTDKPILIYWLMQVSFRIFGVSEFAARFGSALLAIGTTLLTYHLGRKLYSPDVGLLAGMIVCTSLMFSAIGRSVTPDSVLIFCLTLAFTSYVWAVASRRGGHFSGETSGGGLSFVPDDDERPRLSISTNIDSLGLPQRTVDPADASAASKASQSHSVALDKLCTAAAAQSSKPSIAPTVWTELLPTSWQTSLPMYAAMSLAILAKGPIGVLLPCTIIGLLLLVTRRGNELANGTLAAPSGPWWRRTLVTIMQVMRPAHIVTTSLAMRVFLGAAVVLVIALPWYVVVGIKTDGAWLRGFLGDHNVGRFLGPKENHSGPIFYYVIALLMGCFPWSVFLPVGIMRLRQRLMRGDPWSDSDRFVACWAGVWFVFFSLASTKLPNYVLPMYPALALISARYLYGWQLAPMNMGAATFRNCCRVLAVVGVVLMIVAPIAASLLLPGDEWLFLIGAVPLLGATLAYVAAQREQRPRAIRILATSAFAFVLLMVAIAPSRIGLHQDSPKLAEAARHAAGSTDIKLATFNYFSPNLVFYAGQPIQRLRQADEIAQFFEQHPRGFLVTRSDKLNRLTEAMEHTPLQEVTRHRSFLRNHDLVLLGRPEIVAQRDEPHEMR
jgi:4-amino-4-deoxy-L-arabinose transferase-like glycosyltransferase